MTDRILPEPDRYAICPQNGNILSFYGGTFEAAYILLNPFIRPVSITAERYMEWEDMTANDVHCSCEAVSWAKVQQLSEFSTLQEVDWALKTSIGAVSKKYAREDLSTKLFNALQSNRLYAPVEGRFPELSQNTMLSFIQSLGHQWIWLGDEFCTERRLHWIDDLRPPAATAELGRSSAFTPDKALLWTVHWDSHFSLFCSTRENVDRLSRWPGLEGFPCTQDTEVFWSWDCLVT